MLGRRKQVNPIVSNTDENAQTGRTHRIKYRWACDGYYESRVEEKINLINNLYKQTNKQTVQNFTIIVPVATGSVASWCRLRFPHSQLGVELETKSTNAIYNIQNTSNNSYTKRKLSNGWNEKKKAITGSPNWITSSWSNLNHWLGVSDKSVNHVLLYDVYVTTDSAVRRNSLRTCGCRTTPPW